MFWKSVNIYWRYGQEFGVLFFITADTAIAYIIHDVRPNISNRHEAKQRGGLFLK